MKPLNFKEIELMAIDLTKQVGARFQNTLVSEDSVAFEIYDNGEISWLLFVLKPTLPILLQLDKAPLSKSKTTPFGLFFKAHVLGKRLRSVETKGRVLTLFLGPEEDSAELEFRLFPHGQNLICRTKGKKVSWEKIKELKEDGDAHIPEIIRTWKEISEEFSSLKSTPAPQKTTIESEIQKRTSGINKIKENTSENFWKHAGNWIKENQSLDVPSELAKYVNKKLKLSKNIENCFEKAKQFERKRIGSLERLRQLEKEIESLKAGMFQQRSKEGKKSEKTFRGFRVELSSGSPGFVGKTAKDNIDLLRQSKAWHFWIHLKDYPGAHGFIPRNKNETISLEDIKKVALKLGERSKINAGETFDVVVAECRYVKPIKGDKLGRVTYSNETSHTFRYRAL